MKRQRRQTGRLLSKTSNALPRGAIKFVPRLELLEDRIALAADYGYALSIGSATGNELGGKVATDGAGNAYVVGSFMGTVDCDPGPGTANLTSVGDFDVFVAKYTSTGALLWANQLGGSSADTAADVFVDSAGNVLTVGQFRGTADFFPGAGVFNLTSATVTGGSTPSADIFISKLDATGNFVWARRLGGGSNSDSPFSVAVDVAGNVYTTGQFGDGGLGNPGVSADFDPGPGSFNLTSVGNDDVFLSKLDSAGNFVWARRWGGVSHDSALALAVDTGGTVYSGGLFSGTVDFDVGVGIFNMTQVAGNAGFVQKLDSGGNFVWAKQWVGGSGGSSGVSGLAIDSQGNVVAAGSFNGTADFDPGTGVYNLASQSGIDMYVAKLSGDGAFQWAGQMGGISDQYVSDLALDSAGNVFTTGQFLNTTDFDPASGVANLTSAGAFDVFVSKITRDGYYAWASKLGGKSNDRGQGIAVDNAGRVYVTGDFAGTADFDPGVGVINLSVQGANNSDVFLSRLVETGNQPPASVSLSNSALSENAGANAIVGTLASNDPDAGNTFNYSLVAGIGSNDNAQFIITGNQLRAAASLDFETQAARTVRIRTTDQDGLYFERVFAISVLDTNDAPVIDPIGNPQFDPVVSGDSNNSGIPVSTLLERSMYSDPDSNALRGIAVVSVANANGAWQYSIDGGFNWSNFGNSTTAVARLLAADGNTRVRFVSNAGFSGPSGMSFRGWDQSNGLANGSVASTVTNGGISAYSALIETATISVTVPPNHAPEIDLAGNPTFDSLNQSPISNPGNLISEIVARTLYSDVDPSDGRGLAITSAANIGGVWQYSLNSTSWVFLGNPSPSNARLLAADALTRLRFVPDSGFRGTSSISFRAWDRTNGLSSGSLANTTVNGNSTAFSAAIETAAIEVTGVNQAPIAVNDSYTLDEDNVLDVPTSFFTYLLRNDSDDHDPDSALTAFLVSDVDHGQLRLSPDGGFIYTPFANFHGVDAFSYRVEDTEGLTSNVATVLLTVESVNDDPIGRDDRVFVPQGLLLRGDSVLSNDSDCDDDHVDLTVEIIAGPSHARQFEMSLKGVFVYQPDENYRGIDYAFYIVRDPQGGQSRQVQIEFEVFQTTSDPGNESTWVGDYIFHSRAEVPDFDQRREFSPTTIGLPANGSMYCVPTSIINWMAYLADHGYPQTLPSSGPWTDPEFNANVGNYNLISTSILLMGQLMETDPITGSNSGGSHDGLIDWLEQWGLDDDFDVVTLDEQDGNFPELEVMLGHAMVGGLVRFSVGWYKVVANTPVPVLGRNGGHAMSFIGGLIDDANGPHVESIIVNDPAKSNDPNDTRFTQSAFGAQIYNLQTRRAYIGLLDEDGDFSTMYDNPQSVQVLTEYSSSNHYAVIDNVQIVMPKSGIVGNGDLVTFIQPGHYDGSAASPTRSYRTADGTSVADLAVNSRSHLQPYLTEGSNTVWRINQVTGESSAWVQLDSPKRLAHHARANVLYVLENDRLTAINPKGLVTLQAALPPVAFDAIAIDESNDQVVAVSAQSGKLYFFDQDLDLRKVVDIPSDSGFEPTGGRVSIAISTDGIVWLHRENAASLTRLAFSAAGEARLNRFDICPCGSVVQQPRASGSDGGAGESDSGGLVVDSQGHVFLTINGSIVELDEFGNPLDRSFFNGLPGGSILGVTRSVSNLDGSHDGPAFRNVLPTNIFFADAGQEQVTRAGNELTFDASNSLLPEDASPSYTWDFGDGHTTTGATVSHVYASAGKYLVRLVISDGLGSSNHDSVEIMVLPAPPVADAGPDRSATEGELVNLIGSFTDVDSSSGHLFRWSVTASNGQTIDQGANQTFSFTPYDDGTYTVSFTVQDQDGGISTDVSVVLVENSAPQPEWSGPDNVALGEVATFTLVVRDALADMTVGFAFRIDWDNDGTVDQTISGPSGTTVQHIFTEAGQFEISVVASDKDGKASEPALFPIEATGQGFTIDVTSLVSFRYYGAQYNSRTKTYAFYGTITNISDQPIQSPIEVGWSNLAPTSARAKGNSGTWKDGSPYFDLSEFVGSDRILQPGETSQPRTFAVTVAFPGAYSFATRVTGKVSPSLSSGEDAQQLDFGTTQPHGIDRTSPENQIADTNNILVKPVISVEAFGSEFVSVGKYSARVFGPGLPPRDSLRKQLRDSIELQIDRFRIEPGQAWTTRAVSSDGVDCADGKPGEEDWELLAADVAQSKCV